MQKSFHFIRHGKISKKISHIFKGREHEPLSDQGKKDVLQKCKELEAVGIKKIYTSPCLRAYQTAQIIAQNLNCPMEVLADLDEWHMTLRRLFLGVLNVLKLSPPFFEGTLETPKMFKERIEKLLRTLIRNDEKILVVSHGYFLKMLLHVMKPGKKHPFFKKSLPHAHIIKIEF